ncbi:MAG: hypothetical protein LBV01_05425 [Deltaproteobacteria bacterium]|jgi:hypothetical protein|nr:hypothetical protein [Deltaproteobacteria bacterium]
MLEEALRRLELGQTLSALNIIGVLRAALGDTPLLLKLEALIRIKMGRSD